MFEEINDHTVPAPRQADPVRHLDHEIRLKLVIRLRSEGKSSYEIGQTLGVPDRTVRNWLSEASQQVRAENRQFTSEMFTIHQHRCESLYAMVRKRLEDPISFTTDLVKVALAILDRQSRLLGLDRTKNAGRTNSNDWLENASTEELVQAARDAGIPVPESFNTKVQYGAESGGRGMPAAV
jgi:hypothetical protein